MTASEAPLELRDYFIPAVIQQMKNAIAAAGGNEVFFLAKTDRKLVAQRVEVKARGNAEAVPAVTATARLSDVVIHNHPDGCLYPSRADLLIAAEIANRGIGFYIVDNRVENIYVVVHPFKKEEEHPLEMKECAGYLLPGGPVSHKLTDFEYRDEQLQMMEQVVTAFNDDLTAMIEAGTGTGKSMAYLIPAMKWALQNDERIVVSTNTINLQEQLIQKDIPLLNKLNKLNCNVILVKGRYNYLCLRKLKFAMEEEFLLASPEERGEFEAIAAWARKTTDGSLSDLSFYPRREVWERLGAEADQCARLHCPHYMNCFFYRARRAASEAHILVVNHHLLLSDIAVRSRTDSYERQAVLPRFHRIIIDEAQHLEDVATDYFGFHLSRYGFFKALLRLQNNKDPSRGLFPFISARLRKTGELHGVAGDALRFIETELLPERHKLELDVDMGFDRLTGGVKEIADRTGAEGAKFQLRVTPVINATPFWQETLLGVARECAGSVIHFSEQLKELLRMLRKLTPLEKEGLESALIELSSICNRLLYHAECLTLFAEGQEGYCRWLELKKRRSKEWLALCSAPLDIAENMNHTIYQRFGTVILTSATLTVNGRFTYFNARLGLDNVPKERRVSLALPSPFNFLQQAFVAIPTGITEPDNPGYEAMLAQLIESALRITGGRTLILFTSYRLLKRVSGELEPVLQELGIQALKQGTDHRSALLRRFRTVRSAVLFATDSFWEGIDVRGEALQCVIITRLPFRVPTEPIQQARVEAITGAGGDPFMEYSLPQAVIKFRQGFGRLIRHRDDFGAVLILDGRAHTRRYGRIFLKSLPETTLHRLPPERLFTTMKQFFEKQGVNTSGTGLSP